MQRIAVSFLIAAIAILALPAAASAAFGVKPGTFKADVFADAGHTTVETEAGSTPYDGVTEFELNNTLGLTDGYVKNIRVDLPAGLISNPMATPRCTQEDFTNGTCANNTKIGKVDLVVANLPYSTDVFNLVPAANQVSDFGFSVMGVLAATHIIGGVRWESDYGLFFTISDVPPDINLSKSVLTFFGNPAARNGGGGAAAPFIRLPTACLGVQTTKLTVESHNGETVTATDTTDVGADSCNTLPFAPTLGVTPDTTKRDSPAGVKVNVQVPWENDPTKQATSHVKDTVVVLPPGMSINPAAATGLQACSDEQFAQGTRNPVACPDASKVGTAKITSPVLAAPLTGSVFLGTPLADNPYRLFVVVEGFGLSVRLKGRVAPDPVTGQLTTTFADTPQVPFTDFELSLNGGPTATLATPLACGPAATTSAITPHSGNAPASPGSSFTVDLDGAGGDCPATPFSLGLSAGTTNLAAGAFSPFVLTVTRDDGNEFLSGLTVHQPPGLLGILKSVPMCEEALAAQGTCPESSRVGTSTVASGAGPAPFSLSGPVYLAGPHAGSPFSLVIAIRALAGPFDLGTVVVRAGIKVDPRDSHLVIESPSLPTILQGIPLRLRTVTVAIDRPDFLFNPTNCAPLTVGATFTSSAGTTQQASSPFQVTGCDTLPFAPKMAAVTKAAKRGDPAGLTVRLSQQRGEAGTKSVAVQLPPQLAARLDTAALSCLEATFEADPAKCNPESRVGTVRAVTPLLAAPLTGTVYLEQHTRGQLPTLEAILQGSGVTVRLSGTIELGNGVKSTFKSVPDVPITDFVLDLPPGQHSALAATADLCAAPVGFTALIVGQNAKQIDVKAPVEVAGCGVRITRARVKGRVATLTIRVPAGGRVTVTGKGVKRVRKNAAAAGSQTLRAKLSRKGVASLRKKRRLPVRLRATFVPKKGAVVGGEAVRSSTATRTVRFRRTKPVRRGRS